MAQFRNGLLVGLVPFLGIFAGFVCAIIDGRDIAAKGIDTPKEYNPAQWFYEDRQHSAGAVVGAIIQILAIAAYKLF